MTGRNVDALMAYLEDRADWRFGYGREARTHDCARFAAGAIEAVSGVNPLKRFPSRWSTPLGAARVIRRHGGMAAALTALLTEIDPPLAQRGDIAMTPEGALVVVGGDGLIGVSDLGVSHLPRAHAVRAWSAI